MIIAAMISAALMQPSHEWVVAHVQPDAVTAVDKGTVQHQANRTTFWTINVKRDLDERGARFLISRNEVNCQSPSDVMTTSMTAYRDDGSAIVTFNPKTSSAIPPGTLVDYMVGMVCRNEWPDDGINAPPAELAAMVVQRLKR